MDNNVLKHKILQFIQINLIVQEVLNKLIIGHHKIHVNHVQIIFYLYLF